MKKLLPQGYTSWLQLYFYLKKSNPDFIERKNNNDKINLLTLKHFDFKNSPTFSEYDKFTITYRALIVNVFKEIEDYLLNDDECHELLSIMNFHAQRRLSQLKIKLEDYINIMYGHKKLTLNDIDNLFNI